MIRLLIGREEGAGDKLWLCSPLVTRKATRVATATAAVTAAPAAKAATIAATSL